MIPLEKYKLGMDVKISELDFALFKFIIFDNHKTFLILFLLLLIAFFVGYFVGFNNAVVECNHLIYNITKDTMWVNLR